MASIVENGRFVIPAREKAQRISRETQTDIPDRVDWIHKSYTENLPAPQTWFGRFWRKHIAVPFEMKVRSLAVISDFPMKGEK